MKSECHLFTVGKYRREETALFCGWGVMCFEIILGAHSSDWIRQDAKPLHDGDILWPFWSKKINSMVHAEFSNLLRIVVEDYVRVAPELVDAAQHDISEWLCMVQGPIGPFSAKIVHN